METLLPKTDQNTDDTREVWVDGLANFILLTIGSAALTGIVVVANEIIQKYSN